MTQEQYKEFREHGFVCIRGAIAKSSIQPVKTYVLDELKRFGIWSAGRAQSHKVKDLPVFQQTTKLGQLIRYPNLNERLISQDLRTLMSQLAGVELSSGEYAQLLISLPHRVAWTLEGLRWHRDISQAQFARTPGIQAFILLDDLSEKGGATVALAGSHRLKRPDQAKQVLSTLVSGGARQRVIVDGIPLFFIEMAGRAGDVYLMDMRLLHTPSINATKHLRLMATTRHLAIQQR